MLKLKTVTKVANKENLKELVLTSIASLFIYLFVYIFIESHYLFPGSLITLGSLQNTSLIKTLNNCS